MHHFLQFVIIADRTSFCFHDIIFLHTSARQDFFFINIYTIYVIINTRNTVIKKRQVLLEALPYFPSLNVDKISVDFSSNKWCAIRLDYYVFTIIVLNHKPAITFRRIIVADITSPV